MPASRFTTALTLLAVVASPFLFARGDDAAETAALKRIPTFVRSVEWDEQLPGSPVVGLNLGLIYDLEIVRRDPPPRFRDEDVDLLRLFPDLRTLALMHCEITDKGLVKLAAQEKLTSLHLTGCDKVTGTGLGSLTKLKELRLSYCDGVKSLPIAPLQKLTYLGILTCDNFSGAALSELRDLPNLSHLKLLSCRNIADSDLGVVKALHSLRHLALTFHYDQADAGLTNITDLQALETLSLQGKLISDAGLSDLGRLGKLKSLGLSSSMITNDGVRVLTAIPSLTEVVLDCKHVTGEGMQVLGELPNLTGLEFYEHYEFDDAELAQIKKCKHLKRLVLNGGGEVSSAGMAGLRELPDLDTLVLDGFFELEALRPIKALTNLKVLQIAFPFNRAIWEFRDAESFSAIEVILKEVLRNFAVREFRDALSSTEIIWREHGLKSSGSWYRESVPRRNSEPLPDDYRLPYDPTFTFWP